MTSTKARSAGLGAVATFAGFAASLGAGTAHAAESTGTHHAPTPNKVCTIDRDDVEFRAVDTATPQAWTSAAHYHSYITEPAGGFEVRLKDSAKECGGSIDVSLASYTTHGSSWSSSGGAQGFVGYATTTLEKGRDTVTLAVKLPGTTGKSCFGQLDLYFGKTIFDGGTGKGHGPLPDHDHGVTTPNPDDLIASWNGGTVDCETTTPPTTPPPSPQSPPSPPESKPSTPPTTAPSTPVQPTSSAPSTPKPSTPATSTTAPPTTTSSPGTPTLAHTGSNAGAISVVALAFFGAGGTVMLASRKAAARKH
ncbi:MAG: hypothetical protein HOV83_39240 [Catenulispora sp.]|nr:hypothetical protein [Catenulispora sp.]